MTTSPALEDARRKRIVRDALLRAIKNKALRLGIPEERLMNELKRVVWGIREEELAP